MLGPHLEGKCLRGPQIKVKKALRAALRRPKSSDAALYAE